MITSVSGFGGVSPTYAPTIGTGASGDTGRLKETGGSFDQVSISQEPSGESRFQRELTSRLVGEVRTVNTTGDIQRIREDLRGGNYHPDPAEIAGKMLLEGFTFGKG